MIFKHENGRISTFLWGYGRSSNFPGSQTFGQGAFSFWSSFKNKYQTKRFNLKLLGNLLCSGTVFKKRKNLLGCGMASVQVCAATPPFSMWSIVLDDGASGTVGC